MPDDPVLDGRRREEIAEHVRSIGPSYTDDWDPEGDDVGSVLVDLFAGMAGDVAERLDRVPEKHRVAFLDAVGFERDPPQPAELPVSVAVADVDEPVRIPAGTEAIAEPDDGATQHFAVTEAFEATPAGLECVYSVDPATDTVVDHTSSIASDAEAAIATAAEPAATTDAARTLFSAVPPDAENSQRHALYVGDAAALDLGDGPSLRLSLRTSASPLTIVEDLVWEYFGERESEDGAEWRPFPVVQLVPGEAQRVSVDALLAELPARERSRIGEAWRSGDYAGAVGRIETFLAQFGLGSTPAELYDQGYATPDGLEAGAPLTDERLRQYLVWRSPQIVEHDDVPDAEERRTVWLGLHEDGSVVETTVAGVESRWIRCRVPSGDLDEELQAFEVGSRRSATAGDADGTSTDASDGFESPVELGSGATELSPDRMLANDVPTPTGDDAAANVLPFGDWPREQDAFYVASRDAFTKTDVRASLSFSGGEGPDDSDQDEAEAGEANEEADGETEETADEESGGSDGETETGTVEATVVDDTDDAIVADAEYEAVADTEYQTVADTEYQTVADAEYEAVADTDYEAFANADYDAVAYSNYQTADYQTADYQTVDYQATGHVARPASEHSFVGEVMMQDDQLVIAQTTGVDSGEPERPVLSWEYFDGDGWTALPDVDDDTDALRSNGRVSFVVPDDLAPTSVAGHEEHWIRARLVGGSYGDLGVERDDDAPTETWVTRRSFEDAPAYDGCSVSYEDERWAPDHLVAENNLEFGTDYVEAGRERFRPFQPLPDDGQTLYLGFDGPLSNGPIGLLVDPEDQSYPTTFSPGVSWEYRPDADREEWVRAESRDGTDGLTDRGIVGLSFERPTGQRRRFGQNLHWLRARVTRQQFGTSPADGESVPAGDAALPADRDDAASPSGENGAATSSSQDGAETPACLPDPCGATIQTEPPSGGADTHLPAIRSIVPNAAWARNERTVEREHVGSSDGSANQSFTVSSPPLMEASVWIDEASALPADRRAALLERAPERVEVVGSDDDPSAVWVQWERQPDLVASGPDDRHYEADAVAGRIAFGDDQQGRIPPPGDDNVRVTYGTGGGRDGNVERGAVESLDRSMASVEAVTNPLPGVGGADAEPTEAVGARGAATLRDRDRAVTAADVERVARSASRDLARVRCLPGMDSSGQETPGWVTLLVVPDRPGERPTPSATLCRTVESAVADRAAVGLADAGHLVVRGPSYVPVAVEADVETTGDGTLTAVEEAARRALTSFLDPLAGGPAEDGWSFGELPCVSALYECLEAVDGVDHVDDLAVRMGSDGSHLVRPGDPAPSVAADALVTSGQHEVVATLPAAGGRPTEGSS